MESYIQPYFDSVKKDIIDRMDKGMSDLNDNMVANLQGIRSEMSTKITDLETRIMEKLDTLQKPDNKKRRMTSPVSSILSISDKEVVSQEAKEMRRWYPRSTKSCIIHE